MELIEELVLGYAGLENTLSSLTTNKPYQSGVYCEPSCKPPIRIKELLEILQNTEKYWFRVRQGDENLSNETRDFVYNLISSYGSDGSKTINDLQSYLQDYYNSKESVDKNELINQRNRKKLARIIINIIKAIDTSKVQNPKYSDCMPMQSYSSGNTYFLSKECIKIFEPGSIIVNRLNGKQYMFITKYECPTGFNCGQIYVYKSMHLINNKQVYYILSNYGETILLYNMTNITLIMSSMRFIARELYKYISKDFITVFAGHSAGAVISYYFAGCIIFSKGDIKEIISQAQGNYNKLTGDKQNPCRLLIDETIGEMSILNGFSYIIYTSYLTSLKTMIDELRKYNDNFNSEFYKKMRECVPNNIIVFTTGTYAIFPSDENAYPDIKLMTKMYNNHLISIGNEYDPYLILRTDFGLLDPSSLYIKSTYEGIKYRFTEIGEQARKLPPNTIIESNLSDENHHLSNYIELLVKLYSNKDILKEMIKRYNLESSLVGGSYKLDYYKKYLKYKHKYLEYSKSLLNREKF